jgi:putative NADH-flavin reductase
MENKKVQAPMRILIIGANGGIGRQAVEIALAAGRSVTALVRDPAKLTLTHAKLEVVKGDIMRPETFENFLGDKDAVISAIGVAALGPTTLYSEGNKNLIAAIKKNAAARAFFISASAIEISPVQSFFIRLFTKYILQKILRNPYADQMTMEKLIKESGINWTIMRPPRLTNKPATGHYRIAINSFLKNCLIIARADVAHFMINNINNERTYKTTVEIAY